MTVYARSDVATEAISAEHGGCGRIHQRPVDGDGQPVKLWALTCHGGCEDVLRASPLWASTVAEIPETPDEKLIREDWDKRGASDQQYVQAMALAKLAHLDIPESLTRVVGAVRAGDADGPASLTSATVECPAGHTVAAGKFCAECGKPLTAAGPGAAADDLSDVPELADTPLTSDPVSPPVTPPAAASGAEHVCRECGKPVHRKGSKGRWPTRCDDCSTAG